MKVIKYDGKCKICRLSISIIKPFSKDYVFDPENDEDEVIYIENNRIYRGFYATRKIMLNIPIFWIFLPIVYFPYFDKIGNLLYRFIAKHRRWI